MQTKPSIVFCHGLWADGSCFSKLIVPLQAEGHECITAQYGLNSTAEDVALTKAAIGRVSGPVVLVGHSYGGTVITRQGRTYLAALGRHRRFRRRFARKGEEAGLGDTGCSETRSIRRKSRRNGLEIKAQLVHRRQERPHGSARSGTLLCEAYGRNHLRTRQQPRADALPTGTRPGRDPCRRQSCS
jgi:pimeloyl-ACP methyl ester carboxylesterase